MNSLCTSGSNGFDMDPQMVTVEHKTRNAWRYTIDCEVSNSDKPCFTIETITIKLGRWPQTRSGCPEKHEENEDQDDVNR